MGTRRKKIVIIGAGVSGLSAAYHLCNSGLHDVTILEAATRIGGRIHTVKFKGETIEYGAQWIHGTDDNAAYKLLSQQHDASQFRNPLICYMPRSDPKLIFESGRKAEALEQRLFQELPHIFGVVETLVTEKIEQGGFNDEDLKSISLINASRDIFNDIYFRKKGYDKLDTSRNDAIFNNAIQNLLIENGASSDLGCLQDFYYTDKPGPDVQPPDEYSELVDILSKSLFKSTIRLSSKVTSIQWKKSETTNNNQDMCEYARNRNDCHQFSFNEFKTDKVMIRFTDGDEMDQFMYADHVIVTISLGCLQQFHEKLFIPNLSVERQHSLSKMGFGIMNKIILFYETPFWKELDFPIYFLWDEDENNDDSFARKHPWCKRLWEVQDLGKHHLTIWIDDVASKLIRGISKVEIGKTCTDLIKKLINDNEPFIPQPDEVIITKWEVDENFLGSFSYIKVGETIKDKNIVAEPLYVDEIPRVLFAGEAMHESRFSTVDGGIETGEREAKRLMNLYDSQRK